MITSGRANFLKVRSASEIHPTKRRFLKDNFDIFQFPGKQVNDVDPFQLFRASGMGMSAIVSVCEADAIGFEPGQWPVD